MNEVCIVGADQAKLVVHGAAQDGQYCLVLRTLRIRAERFFQRCDPERQRGNLVQIRSPDLYNDEFEAGLVIVRYLRNKARSAKP